jgi:hypothetical protein
MVCKRTKWKGRAAYQLSNKVLEVCALVEGGAISSLRLADGVNSLWEAPWPGLDPKRFKKSVHEKKYGPAFVGKFLAGYTGHAICLDYFGAPSQEEIAAGLCLHGEAAVSTWRTIRSSASAKQSLLVQRLELARAGLRFERQLYMRPGESIAHFSETVRNPRSVDQFSHWVQHVTFGPPFLTERESSVFVSGTRAMTWPHGYEGKSLLANSREFSWPNAPAEPGGTVDLSRPFANRGKGFVVSIVFEESRSFGSVAVLNRKLGLVQGYVFPRKLFPWVAVWEENLARNGPPWNGKTQARGLEFGTTPMPVGKVETFCRGPLFGAPAFCRIPARSAIRANYVAFLSRVNGNWQSVRDVRLEEHALMIESSTHELAILPARNVRDEICSFKESR